MKLRLDKNCGTRTSFKQGYQGRVVRTIKVLPREDCGTVISVDDIEKIIPWGELESLIEGDDKASYIPVDKKEIQDQFAKTDRMTVFGAIPRSALEPADCDGYHYFLSVQATKTKTLPEQDQLLYQMLAKALRQRDKALLARYVSSNRTKYCAIYSSRDGGLTMSGLIPGNLLRMRQEQKFSVGTSKVDPGQCLDKLCEKIEMVGIDREQIADEYEQKLKEHLELVRSGSSVATPKIRIRMLKPKQEVDILEQILAM
ncbi:MAG: Ku protein [Sulfobacillus sp.]